MKGWFINMARNTIPQLPATFGMGLSPYITSSADYSRYQVDADELWNLGCRKVRMGGTSPLYVNLESEKHDTGTQVAIYKAKGFYVECGGSHLNGVDPQLTSSNWSTYHDYMLDFAQILYSYGLDTFMMGNEMIGSHYDNTTLTLQQMYSNFVTLAEEIRAVCPNIKCAYNGTANEMSTWNTWITENGAIPDYMRLGFNLYGSSDSDTANFQTQVNAVVALQTLNGSNFVYVSEWAIYWDWEPCTHDQELQRQYTAAKKSILDASGLDYFYHVWKFQNPGVPSDWTDYAVKYSLGVPSSPRWESGTRKLAKALFPQRSVVPGITSRSLSFNGTSSYAVCPITPSGGGISLMFWYNRQRKGSDEEYIIGNANPTGSYASAFRLYNDANNRNIILSRKDDASSQSFNTISSVALGVWIHIAIVLTPGATTGLLYINGVQVGNAIPGYIGTPEGNIIIGGRGGDFAKKGKFNMWRLVVQNTNVGFTQQQILDHMNNGTVPAGASWYDFGEDATDQSGNGKDLELNNTSYVSDVDQLYLIPQRSASGSRTVSGTRSLAV